VSAILAFIQWVTVRIPGWVWVAMQQDTRQDMAGQTTEATGQALPLVDAAARLGLTPEALRKRLQRGSIDGYKRDGQWFAWLPAAIAGRQDMPSATIQPQQDTWQETTSSLYAALASELDTLKGEVSFLRDELRRRDDVHTAEQRRRDEIAEQEREQHAAERDALHARLHEALTAFALVRVLPSGEEERATVPASEAPSSPRPWWQFWRRERYGEAEQASSQHRAGS
jgi:hypothetical protein